MRPILHRVVTFSTRPEGGNPAWVLVQDADDSIVETAALARSIGDFAAVVRPDGAGRYRIAFATPAGPHNGAGHAAHAAAHLVLGPGEEAILARPDGTALTARRDDDRITVEWPRLDSKESGDAAAISAALDVPVSRAFVADFGLVGVVESADVLEKLVPDMQRISALDADALIVTAPGDSSDIAIRVFAPRMGLPEDPICGTAHRIIVPVWARQLGRSDIHSRHLSPRGGDLYCRDNGGTVAIGGTALTLSADPWSGRAHDQGDET